MTNRAPGSEGAPDGAAPDRASASDGAASDGAASDGAAPRGRPRRFPAVTRDTARPEGGGRAAPGSAPAPARQWPLLVVTAGALSGLLLTLSDFRLGTVVIGLSLVLGAVLRRALREVGMLAVRSRFTDMITYGVVGAVIVLLALMAEPDPPLRIPFLSELLHFTVG